MPAWSGRVIVTRTVDGTCRIGNSIPAGVPLNYATVQVVDVTGPVELIDGPGMVTLPNPSNGSTSTGAPGSRSSHSLRRTSRPTMI
jgi:hypothetical protein